MNVLVRVPLEQLPRSGARALCHMMRAIAGINGEWLREHEDAPALYASGVRYQAEPPGAEEWLTIPAILQRGHDDCEGLACWLAAELRVRHGHDAVPVIKRTGAQLFHAIVLDRTTGKFHDPSRRLGMRSS